MYITLREIPSTILRALQSVDYSAKDINVNVADSVSLCYPSGDGSRAFAIVGNIDTGVFKTTFGSWGGSNMFTKTIVDDSREEFPIPVNGFVILGCTASHRKSPFATIYVNPHCVNSSLISAPEVLSENETKILACFRALKSGPYRKNALAALNTTEEILCSLVGRGYLEERSNGSRLLTTKGKNACMDVRMF